MQNKRFLAFLYIVVFLVTSPNETKMHQTICPDQAIIYWYENHGISSSTQLGLICTDRRVFVWKYNLYDYRQVYISPDHKFIGFYNVDGDLQVVNANGSELFKYSFANTDQCANNYQKFWYMLGWSDVNTIVIICSNQNKFIVYNVTILNDVPIVKRNEILTTFLAKWNIVELQKTVKTAQVYSLFQFNPDFKFIIAPSNINSTNTDFLNQDKFSIWDLSMSIPERPIQDIEHIIPWWEPFPSMPAWSLLNHLVALSMYDGSHFFIGIYTQEGLSKMEIKVNKIDYRSAYTNWNYRATKIAYWQIPLTITGQNEKYLTISSYPYEKQTQLLSTKRLPQSLFWSPDETYLAFGEFTSDKYQDIYSINLANADTGKILFVKEFNTPANAVGWVDLHR